jgi:hypothetical protein
MSEQFHEYVRQQQEINLKLTATLSRVEEKLDAQNDRLFGAPGQEGALKYLHTEAEAVKVRVGVLETWKTGTVKWVAGAVAVLLMEGTALAFFANHVATAVKAVQAIKGH